MSLLSFRWLAVFWLLCNTQNCSSAEVSDEVLSMRFEQVKSLPLEVIKDLVFDAFSHRIEHAKNIHFDAILVVRNHKFENNSPKEVVWNGLKYRFHHWRLGDSYAIETTLFGDPSNDEPKHFSRTNFDTEEGLGRSITEKFGVHMGAIANRTNPIALQNRYGYWLDGEQNGYATYLFRELVGAHETYEIDYLNDRELLKLVVPWHPRGFPNAKGKWEYLLDSKRGFIPIEATGEWRDASSNHWRKESFKVESAKLVANVWMPLELYETVQASTHRPGVGSVYETKISKIEHGSVTPDDLVVEFKNNTAVVNKIENIAYLADESGQPRADTIRKVIDVDLRNQKPTANGSRLYFYFAIGSVILLTLGWRFLRSRTK